MARKLQVSKFVENNKLQKNVLPCWKEIQDYQKSHGKLKKALKSVVNVCGEAGKCTHVLKTKKPFCFINTQLLKLGLVNTPLRYLSQNKFDTFHLLL